MQRELEDIKKTHSDEINQLKIEVEDLKSKADLENVQVCHVYNRLKEHIYVYDCVYILDVITLKETL